MGLFTKMLLGAADAPVKKVDKALGRTKCPRCRSANVEQTKKGWHCKQCGRDFK